MSDLSHRLFFREDVNQVTLIIPALLWTAGDAMIEAVEQNVRNQVHFALVVEDDPGRDLGLLRQSGHRFFYFADEVEPLSHRHSRRLRVSSKPR